MTIDFPPPDSRRIKKREELIKYRKALMKKQDWDGPLPMGEGELNRDGNPKIPPGQKVVTNWPVLDLGIQPDLPKETWTLTVSGLVGKPSVFNWRDFMALPQVEDISDFHCVTGWSRMDNHWVGVRFKDVIAACSGPVDTAQFVYIKGYDGYSTNLPLAEAMHGDVLLAHHWEHKPLAREHGGPVRMITPKLWAWKGSKWISGIILRDHDELGFWEQRGYSNTAEPWLNDRYSSPE